MRLLLSFPLLLLAYIAYGLLAFSDPAGLTAPALQVNMMSGAVLSLSWSDSLIIFALFLLFIEAMKAAAFGNATIVDHMLSTVLFIGGLIAFLLVSVAGSSTFLILVFMSLIDVVAGYTISIRTARRDVGIGGF